MLSMSACERSKLVSCANWWVCWYDRYVSYENFTSNKRGGNRYLPFVFIREGIAMLSGLLRSEIAIQANINIMRAFFQMQEALLIVSMQQVSVTCFISKYV